VPTHQPEKQREMALKSTKEVSPWEKVTNARNVEKFTGELSVKAAARKKALRKKRKNNASLLNRAFFNRDTLTVARDLLGKRLVRCSRGQQLSGMVVETEAYRGTDDSASHAFRGQTPRNTVMFGPAGVAYVYLVYGMHYMLNVITEAHGTPGAVLLRAVEPLEGIDKMTELRGGSGRGLADGPGKLCQALAVDLSLQGVDLTLGERLWFETLRDVPANDIVRGPRVGIAYASEADRQAPWRFRLSTAALEQPIR
jgi:DNA-3-methyladenine glycosylase